MQGAAKRIVLNTGILYGRMILTVGVSLYTTRLILNILGAVDFGIFNLVAGVIALLAFLNNAMATSTQRYLSFYQGQNNVPMQKEIFSNALLLHVFIGLVLVLLLELTGLFLFESILNIPSDRLPAAKVVYHWAIISVFFTVLSVPFTGSLIAHENMLWVAIVGILEVVMKLILAIALASADSDKLILYSVGITSISIFNFFLYVVYCVKKYPECQNIDFLRPNAKLMKDLSTFSGWNLFGALCHVGKTQGIAVILNFFFGTVINAAYGIANQVSSQLNFFSSTMLRAINPQIMKSEGAGDRERMLKLSMTASKFGLFLFAIVAIPFVFEMDSILGIWLNNVPEMSVPFCQLVIFRILANQFTIGLQSSFQAMGKIKYYQIIVGSLLLLSLPLAYFLLSLGFSPVYAIYATIWMELLACLSRIYLLNRITGNIWKLFLNDVLRKEIIPISVNILVCFCICRLFDIPFRFLLTFSFSAFSFIVTIYCFGLTDSEKHLTENFIGGLVKKIKGNVFGIN